MRRALAITSFLLWVTMLPAAAPSSPEEIPLWRDVAPGSEGKTGQEYVVNTDGGVRRIAGIHRPSITMHLPPADRATGAAVIVLPGGGHRYLSIDNEGHHVAQWLSERGVAGIVLKYRLAREEGSTYRVDEHAFEDAQRAIRVVRSRAKAWHVDPQRIGLLGFSAGGQVVGYAASRYDAGASDSADPIEREGSRPAFQGYLYSGSVDAALPVPADAPPAFIGVAFDDETPTKHAIAIFERLRAAKVSAELHVYAKGGHGFGMRERPLPITSWRDRFREWLADQGFVQGTK